MRSFINQDKAYQVITSTDDPVEKALLSMALNVVRAAMIQEGEQSTDADNTEVQAPFDLLFYIQVVSMLFESKARRRLQRILEGDEEAMQDFPDFD